MALHGLLLHQQLLLLLIISAVRAASQSNSICERKCGNVEIPYPFGTSWGCYLDESFHINCKNMSGIPKPVLAYSDIEVLNISLEEGELLVSTPLTRSCFNNFSSQSISSKFPISNTKNKFVAVGCEIIAYVRDSSGIYASSCISSCVNSSVVEGSCFGCSCEDSIPQGVVGFEVGFVSYTNSCVFAFVVKKGEFLSPSSDLQNLQNKSTVPVVLDLTIANKTCGDACKANNSECYKLTNGPPPGYRCNCSSGFEGNAYIENGCKGTS